MYMHELAPVLTAPQAHIVPYSGSARGTKLELLLQIFGIVLRSEKPLHSIAFASVSPDQGHRGIPLQLHRKPPSIGCGPRLSLAYLVRTVSHSNRIAGKRALDRATAHLGQCE